MRDIECPYCKEEVEIDHDDGYGYEEGKVFNQECEHCNKTFTYTTSISYCHEAQQAPCLNGEEHKWKDIHGYPMGYQSNRQRCEYCDEEGFKDVTLKYDGKNDIWVKKLEDKQ
jgi:glutaredoxin